MEKWQETGDTVEEAIEKALKIKDLSRDQVDVKILEEPSKGFLGFGKKPAKVEVALKNSSDSLLSDLSLNFDSILKGEQSSETKETSFEKSRPSAMEDPEVLEEAKQVALRFVEEIAYLMGAEITAQVKEREEDILVSVEGDKNGILIGKHGRTLNALQYLTGLAVHKVIKGRVRVVVDVEDYRERRQATLENLAAKYANQALEKGSKIVLEPMNPQERRLIHVALQEDDRVSTESEGEEPFRKVVIIPKNLQNDEVIYIEKFQKRGRGFDRPRNRY